jgi:hypothetical protein
MKRRQMNAWKIIPACCALLGALSCGDGTGPNPIGPPGVRVIEGRSNGDTVYTRLTQALIVEVRQSSGRVVPEGTIVRFEPVTEGFAAEVLVSPLDGSVYGILVADEANAQGRASTRVQLGSRAGDARLVVTVPEYGIVDTVTFTALPGNPVRVRVLPDDTTLFVSRSYTPRGGVTDQFGNVRPEPVTWSAGSGLSVTPAGVVSSSATGRYEVRATWAGNGTPIADTISVSVVPQLRLAAWQFNWSSQEGIVSVMLDGSDRRFLAPLQNGGIGAHPAWLPGSDDILYSSMSGEIQRIYAVTQAGVVRPWIATVPSGMTHQAEPVATASGNWVYFSAFSATCGTAGDYCVHRATVGGGGVAPLLMPPYSRNPAPSPDGNLVAFTPGAFTNAIRVYDVVANSVSSWSVSGERPAWSPTGTTIAYINGGRVMTVNADGGNVTTLTPTTTGWNGQLRWSPDGNWLITRRDDALWLLEVATGTALRLGWSTDLAGGSLK